jgi:uncharacterized protein (TIGR00106 family)
VDRPDTCARCDGVCWAHPEEIMKAIADISIIPLGVGLSLSPYVAACEVVFREAGLEPRLHANGTNVEGEWDTVLAALKACHEKLHAMGVPRIATNVRLGTRVDREASMDAKLSSVKEKMKT